MPLFSLHETSDLIQYKDVNPIFQIKPILGDAVTYNKVVYYGIYLVQHHKSTKLLSYFPLKHV